MPRPIKLEALFQQKTQSHSEQNEKMSVTCKPNFKIVSTQSCHFLGCAES